MNISTATEAKTAPTIFFIPGAWHSPWVFDHVRDLLSARGFETEASSLATVGAADPRVGVFDDAAGMRSALASLADEGKEVVVVAHSYGGFVASHAVDGLGAKQRASTGLRGGILMILYLAAFVIPPGTDLLTMQGGSYPWWWDVSEDGFMMPKQPLDVFYADVEASLAEKAVASLRPIPLQVAKDVSAYDSLNGNHDVGYVFAEQDKAIAIQVQEAVASRFPEGSFMARLDSSHSPFFSMPNTLVDTIERAVKHALAKRSSETLLPAPAAERSVI
ncbi:Alpha/beta hydrolase fold-1 [Xylaria palmicola]|nr:Alpha/beta hydrolase fold-1 [Xylaria palmicola]